MKPCCMNDKSCTCSSQAQALYFKLAFAAQAIAFGLAAPPASSTLHRNCILGPYQDLQPLPTETPAAPFGAVWIICTA